ncbi:MAG: aminotransferase class I/II-fold pyridoxal phosphate-dependent enzyme, partial [Hyphomicrobiales bacterium]|nr:aminotransferase class I/II-fold pyridoxal phosphate-dependent enzyme [Hyphomicrobiales bacterium]
MFENLSPAAPDKILALMAEYRQDPRSDKIDLGVGIYRDADGRTPVLSAVRKAEKRLYDGQDTKAYVGIAGDVGFNAAMIKLALGDALPAERVRGAQTPGGCGALRIIAELLNRARAGATVWLSDPTWPNHRPILAAAGLATGDYPYFDAASGKVKFDEMIAALSAAPAGDVVLLHG